MADVQLQPGDLFYLILQREKTILTDARVVNYDGDYVINGSPTITASSRSRTGLARGGERIR